MGEGVSRGISRQGQQQVKRHWDRSGFCGSAGQSVYWEWSGSGRAWRPQNLRSHQRLACGQVLQGVVGH